MKQINPDKKREDKNEKIRMKHRITQLKGIITDKRTALVRV